MKQAPGVAGNNAGNTGVAGHEQTMNMSFHHHVCGLLDAGRFRHCEYHRRHDVANACMGFLFNMESRGFLTRNLHFQGVKIVFVRMAFAGVVFRRAVVAHNIGK